MINSFCSGSLCSSAKLFKSGETFFWSLSINHLCYLYPTLFSRNSWWDLLHTCFHLSLLLSWPCIRISWCSSSFLLCTTFILFLFLCFFFRFLNCFFFILCNSGLFFLFFLSLCFNVCLSFSLNFFCFRYNLLLSSSTNKICNNLPSIRGSSWKSDYCFLEIFKFLICPISFNIFLRFLFLLFFLSSLLFLLNF